MSSKSVPRRQLQHWVVFQCRRAQGGTSLGPRECDTGLELPRQHCYQLLLTKREHWQQRYWSMITNQGSQLQCRMPTLFLMAGIQRICLSSGGIGKTASRRRGKRPRFAWTPQLPSRISHGKHVFLIIKFKTEDVIAENMDMTAQVDVQYLNP